MPLNTGNLCTSARRLITKWVLEGELPSGQKALLMSHLQYCETCNALYNSVFNEEGDPSEKPIKSNVNNGSKKPSNGC